MKLFFLNFIKARTNTLIIIFIKINTLYTTKEMLISVIEVIERKFTRDDARMKREITK